MSEPLFEVVGLVLREQRTNYDESTAQVIDRYLGMGFDVQAVSLGIDDAWRIEVLT